MSGETPILNHCSIHSHCCCGFRCNLKISPGAVFKITFSATKNKVLMLLNILQLCQLIEVGKDRSTFKNIPLVLFFGSYYFSTQWLTREAYLETCQTSMIVILFTKTLKEFQLLTILQKNFITDVQGFKAVVYFIKKAPL